MVLESDMTRHVSPEDLRVDDYVTISRQTHELLFGSVCEEGWRRPRIERVTVRCDEAGYPLRIVRLCLPFVLVTDPSGSHRVLDVRCHELAKLSPRFGKKAFKCLASPTSEPSL